MRKKLSVIFFLLILMMFANALFAATKVVAEFQIYLSSAKNEADSSVIVGLPIGQLTPTMGLELVDDIKRTFNLNKIAILSSPRVETEVGKSAKIMTDMEGITGIKGKRLTIDLNPISVNKRVVHVKVSLRIGEKQCSTTDFFASFGKVVTLAERLDHHYLFVLCSFSQGSEKSKFKPRLVKRVAPDYPEEMRKQGKEGLVILEIEITPEGNVSNVKVIKSPNEAFSKAAIDAVKLWRWSLSSLENSKEKLKKPIKTTLTFKFSLGKNEKD